MPAKVATIEYDPNRTARIALLHYADGAKAYILAPQRLTVGAIVQSGADADIRPGNCAAAVGRSRSAPRCTPSSCGPGQGATAWRARPARRPSSSPRRAARRSCACPPASSAACRRLPRHHRRGRQRDAPERVRRQGRALALARPAPGRARHRDEPRRPPARRRRGQDQGLAPGHPVGQADARSPHAQSQEGVDRGDRPRPQARQGQEVANVVDPPRRARSSTRACSPASRR